MVITTCNAARRTLSRVRKWPVCGKKLANAEQCDELTVRRPTLSHHHGLVAGPTGLRHPELKLKIPP